MKHKWSEKLESIESCLMKWEKRDLTLFGKVQVMKILALPKIILSATILHVPQDVISELTKIFFKFLWGKVDRVKRLKVIQDYFNGGLGMIDINCDLIVIFTRVNNDYATTVKEACGLILCLHMFRNISSVA